MVHTQFEASNKLQKRKRGTRFLFTSSVTKEKKQRKENKEED
jgi:hypothetical protein